MNTLNLCYGCNMMKNTAKYRSVDLCRKCTIDAMEEFSETIGGSEVITPPMTLEQIQKKGRSNLIYVSGRIPNEIFSIEAENLNQHTANTWNEARESLLVDMKREMKSWSGTGTAMIKDYETKARDYD